MTDNFRWFEKSDLDKEAINNILPCNIAVDIGTGIRPHDFVDSAVCICCEPYAEYVEILKNEIDEKTDKIYVVKQQTWAEALDCLADKSIDTIFLIDVIEHLPKDEGMMLLRRTEGIARKQIVLFTPLGFVAQHTLEGGKDAWGLSGAEWQEHKSGWFPEDFDESWNIFACKNYHDYSNIGEKLDEPFGAFWAIKSFSNKEEFECNQVYGDVCDAIRNMITKFEKFKNDIDQQGRLNVELQQVNVELQSELGCLQKDKKILDQQNECLQQDILIARALYRDLENTKAVRSARYIKKLFKI